MSGPLCHLKTGSLVTLFTNPFDDHQPTCELAVLCQQVEDARPRLPDGRWFVMRVAGSSRPMVSVQPCKVASCPDQGEAAMEPWAWSAEVLAGAPGSHEASPECAEHGSQAVGVMRSRVPSSLATQTEPAPRVSPIPSESASAPTTWPL